MRGKLAATDASALLLDLRATPDSGEAVVELATNSHAALTYQQISFSSILHFFLAVKTNSSLVGVT